MYDDVLVVPDLLNPEECADVVLEAEERGFTAATVRTQQGDRHLTSIRDNDRVDFEDEALRSLLWHRVRAHLPLRHGIPQGLDPHLRVYRYQQGQRFKRHRDGAQTGPLGESRLSFLVYLNDAAGGATSFRSYTGRGAERQTFLLDIPPVTGTAVLFPHRLWHEGLPVRGGSKYVLRTDVFFGVRTTPIPPEPHG